MLSNRTLKVHEEIENLRNETGALKRAVESKSAAIGILRTELEDCQRERDEFRMIAETHPVSPPVQSLKISHPCPEKIHSAILGGGENTLAQLLSQSKEENKQLKQEITDVRCRLHDAQSDLKILRAEKHRKSDAHQSHLSIATSSRLASHERETHIQQLEHLSSKCQAQENDIRCLLEEREELIKERDQIKHKLHRLNHVLNVILSRDYLKRNRPAHRTVDLDAIITENRYLQQRMKQLEEEKALAIANSSKYKSALETCRSDSSLKVDNPSKLIMSPKQVSEFLKQYEGEVGENAEKDLKFLCVALVDSLNQKSRVVKTQKAANKMLIERVADLEKRLVYNDDDAGDLPRTGTETSLVSASLMEGYNTSATQAEGDNLDVAETILKEITTTKSPVVEESESESPDKGGSKPVVPAVCNLVAPTPEKRESDIQTSNPPQSVERAVDKAEEKTQKDTLRNNESIKSSVEHAPNRKLVSNQSSSDSEEIVPLENLDLYISNLKQKRTQIDSPKIVPKQERLDQGDLGQHASPSVSNNSEAEGPSLDSPDSSFDINISDYESDDDNLDLALQSWQNEFEKTSQNKLMSKLSPKRSVSLLLKKDKRKVEFPEKLKKILN